MVFARTNQVVSFEVLVQLEKKSGRFRHPNVANEMTRMEQELVVEVVVQVVVEVVVEAVAADDAFAEHENR